MRLSRKNSQSWAESMKPFSVLLALGLLIPLAGEEPSAPETAKPLLFKGSFQREFQELTEMLEREYPAFLQSLSPADSGRALSAVMRSLRSGVVPEAEAKPASVPAKAEPDVPAFRLKNGLWYLRINTLNEKTFGELLQTVRKAAQSPGLILDLRGCSAGDWTVRPESLRTLLAPSVLHTAILLGPGTHGAGEILAALLIASHRGIGIGAPTAGCPFPRKVVTVSNRKWLVPVPPDGAEAVRYERLVPQIRVASSLRIPVDSLKKADDLSRTGDRALSRASDLLIGLNLLEQKGLKK